MSGTCLACGKQIDLRHHLLERRIEVVHFGQLGETVNVLYASGEMHFCSHRCWHQHQPKVIEQYQLKNTYPLFAEVSECCRCGGPFDRKQAYTCLVVMEESIVKKPWLTECAVHSDEEFAVLCPKCETPQFEAEEAAESCPILQLQEYVIKE